MRSNLQSLSRRWGLPVIALVAVLGAPLVAGAQQTLSSAVALQLANAPPESVGMSTARLARLTAIFKKEIDDKKLPGAVMMVARQGKLAYATALGARDPKGRRRHANRRHIPHLFDDQAHRFGRRHDPGRGRRA